MEFLYPVPKTSIITQTYNDHLAVARRYGYCTKPQTNCPNGYYYGGIDWACNTGTPIHAAQNGTCDARVESSGYGTHVRLTHAEGYMSIYGHMSKLNCKTGQVVKAGDIIGYVGSTGNSTGPHLHFETRLNNVPFDPQEFLVDNLETVPPVVNNDYLHGIDVSRHNGVMDWRMADNLIDFAIFKFTEGDKWIDPQAQYNYQQCKELSIPMGMYHFVKPSVSALAQFELIKAQVTKEMYDSLYTFPDGTKLFSLDCEETDGKPKYTVTNVILKLSELLKSYYGYRPLIYTNVDFYQRGMTTSSLWKEHKLWVASWDVSTPTLPDFWNDWTIWQYKIERDGEKYGVHSASMDVDVNYMKTTQITPTPEPTPDPTLPTFPVLKEYKVIANVLNIRKGPGVNFPVADTLRKNELVTPFKAVKGDGIWLQVGVNQWVAYYYNDEYLLVREG